MTHSIYDMKIMMTAIQNLFDYHFKLVIVTVRHDDSRT